MNVSKLFRKINNYVKRSFFVVLMYSVIYFILNSLILTFDNNNLSSVTYERDLYIFLFLTLISNLIYRYFQIEVYDSLRNNRKPSLIGVFSQISKRGLKMVGLVILINIKVSLWSLLFVFPGVVKSFEYQRAIYAMTRRNDLSIRDAFKIAKEEMYGYKLNLFWLETLAILPSLFGMIVLVGSFTIDSMETTSLSSSSQNINVIREFFLANFKNSTGNIIFLILGIFALFGFFYTIFMQSVLEPVFNYELDEEISKIDNELDNGLEEVNI